MAIGWKKEEIKTKLIDLLDTILSIALKDRILSEDEKNLLEIMEAGLFNFEEQIITMISEQISVEEANIRIKKMFEDVINNTTQKAKEDGTITPDELILIDRFTKYLRKENFSSYLE